jgi:hypothetical protein
VNSENFHSSCLVWHSNINFTIEATSTTQSGINSVGAVSGTNNDDLTTALDTVHKGEQLSDDTLLDLTL